MAEGTLFYVIGPSGSGKDSLLNYAREQIGGEFPIFFAHRYITRPADAGGENHVALTQAEFDQREALGMFALNWHSHDTSYGIGIEIENWLRTGAQVVVNGSREYLPTASSRFPNMRVILIEVSPDVLRQRLTERGRETPEEIDARIDHNNQIPPIHHPNLTVINNDKGLEESGPQFVKVLKPQVLPNG